ncbi:MULTISPECIES: hypothetical protein [unclassified Bradyrhizobium]|uniref:hypothetical protein n=1 Tax=unclassified Bradyrhizobium TaxID=2631580 RepID=UPI001BABEE14|nr:MULTISPECIES: hypothetical protein [unclassified Bradyrhizobium]MBR1206589.1 hypothetical protein [Bradyrhizobium sp. AUGA SZCCT0124]MBR1315433.1 hypothetical protein [Bradyrhizobium sp. AUGA SZCCT0051]MBR1338505.1 hypothetical protein [Bradyrhizobium sp. AUGA SZCCT0105]MBR1356160.1 hypothetical protein [Bradyrhizobium sp. AUGA SZCCT0045]
MSTATYYVAQPFELTKGGHLVAGMPQQVQSEMAAIRRAESLARKGGAVAFSRTGDLSTGDFEDAKILRTFGQVPDDIL